MFDEETLELAEQLGVDPSEVDSVLDAIQVGSEKMAAADLEFASFLEENDLSGLDLDSGQFY